MDANDGKIKVLIADDDEILCDLLKKVLDKEEDIETVGVAYDGLDACEKIAQLRPDVAVLDCAMPALDGIGVLEKLRTSAYNPVCIMLSGNGNEAVTHRALELGAGYYLIKPFDPEALAERIRIFRKRTGSPEIAGFPYSAGRKKTGGGLEERVTNILDRAGFPIHVQGYYYLRAAIVKCAEDPTCLGAIEKILYRYTAEKFGTTASCVERSIRSAISETYKHDGFDTLKKILGRMPNFRKDKPSSAELIALISDTLHFFLPY